MKMLITYALMDDLQAAITAANAEDDKTLATTATTYCKIGAGRRLSRGYEIILTEGDRNTLLAKARERIACAKAEMKNNPFYWRPLLAAWRALEQRLINDWPNSIRQRAA